MSTDFVPDRLSTPHIPLRSSLRDGIEILQSIGPNITENVESEHYFKLETASFTMAVCAKDNHVASVWYDDPIGRESDSGKERKIELYLMRYGALPNWELRMVNNLMRYWVNARDKAAMVYNLHSDVIRFNQYYEEYA